MHVFYVELYLEHVNIGNGIRLRLRIRNQWKNLHSTKIRWGVRLRLRWWK